MEIRVSEPARSAPPAIRSERQDWHALELDDQGDVSAFRLGAVDLEACSLRAQWFLHRHFGTPTPAQQVRIHGR